MSKSLLDAAKDGCLKEVKELLETGVDIDEEDTDGRTSLYLAAMNGHSDIVSLLLENGADPFVEDDFGTCALFHPCQGGDVRVVNEFIKADRAVDLDVECEYQKTPLLVAAEHGHKDIVELLIQSGANLWSRDSDGKNAQQLAHDNGHEDIVKVIEAEIQRLEEKAKAHSDATRLELMNEFEQFRPSGLGN